MRLGPFLPIEADEAFAILKAKGIQFSMSVSKKAGSGWNPQVTQVYFEVDDALADSVVALLGLPPLQISDGNFELKEDDNE